MSTQTALLALWTVLSASPPATVTLLSDALEKPSPKPVVGELVDLTDEELRIRPAASSEIVRIARSQVLSVAFEPARPDPLPLAPVRVLATDGSRYLAREYRAAGREATVVLTTGRRVSLPIARVLSVLYSSPTPSEAAAWVERATARRSSDVASVSKDKTQLELEGVLGDADDQGVRFTLDGEELLIRKERLRAIYYAHAYDPKDARADVLDSAGNFWVARRVRSDGAVLSLETPGGAATQLRGEELRLLDFTRGRLVYLSDLEPALVQHIPYFDTRWHFRRDASLAGKPLRLANAEHAKGLAVHSRTILEYSLEGRFSRFECLVGIDESAGAFGDAVVRISGDETILWESRVRSGEPPRAVAVPLKDAALLRLEVDYGESLDLGDEVIFAEARLRTATP